MTTVLSFQTPEGETMLKAEDVVAATTNAAEKTVTIELKNGKTLVYQGEDYIGIATVVQNVMNGWRYG